MNRMIKLSGLGAVAALLIGLQGCASTPPPKELLAARQAYDRARGGEPAKFVPAQLHVAEQALRDAERSFADNPKSPVTADKSYVALRKIQLAQAQAAIVRDNQIKEQVQQQVQLTQAQMQQRQLQQTREQLTAQQQQLEMERQAREAAERRMAEALRTVAEVKEEDRGTVLIVPGSVLFATGKATLMPGAQARLDRVAAALKEVPNRDLVVEGYTDATGSDKTNQELSKNRAKVVRDYLVTRGVPSDRIRSEGLGPARPVADNDTPTGRAQNRRVEIVIINPVRTPQQGGTPPTTTPTPP